MYIHTYTQNYITIQFVKQQQNINLHKYICPTIKNDKMTKITIIIIIVILLNCIAADHTKYLTSYEKIKINPTNP